jgi:IclR family pca regulon transcriptional regulator
LAILRCFTAERPALGNATIAEELQMQRSTTHRYLTTLVALGYLEQTASRKYRLGSRTTDLGRAALDCTGLRERARAELEELCEDTGYTASLGVLDEQEIVYVEYVQGRRGRQRDLDIASIGRGSRLPAYCTATGKLLLAYLQAIDRDELIDGLQFAKRAPNTITGKRRLIASLEGALEQGFAVEDEELARGQLAIAAPVRDESREVIAAVGLRASAATISIEQLADAFGSQLIAAAGRISVRLGDNEGERQPT